MKKKIAYIIFIVILFLLFIWTNKLQTLWLFGMFGIIWLPMFFINRYNEGKIIWVIVSISLMILSMS